MYEYVVCLNEKGMYRISSNNVPLGLNSVPYFEKAYYIKKEHYSNFGTFEIASLLNVPGHYLRRYGIFNVKIFDGGISTIIPMHKDYVFQLKSPFQIFFCKWSSYMCCCYEM